MDPSSKSTGPLYNTTTLVTIHWTAHDEQTNNLDVIGSKHGKRLFAIIGAVFYKITSPHNGCIVHSTLFIAAIAIAISSYKWKLHAK